MKLIFSSTLDFNFDPDEVYVIVYSPDKREVCLELNDITVDGVSLMLNQIEVVYNPSGKDES